MTTPVIENVRKSLAQNPHKNGQPGPDGLVSMRPEIYPARQPGPVEAEIHLFLGEVKKLSGVGEQLEWRAIAGALRGLVESEKIRKATAWNDRRLKELGITEQLREMGVEMVSPNADKHEMAQCDLGITSADFLLPETGTIVLKSSIDQPRGVSLLPRIHLAIVTPGMLRADLHQVFAEARKDHYLVFVTGPSRTADIELTVTLGVHGPKNLFVWMLNTEV